MNFNKKVLITGGSGLIGKELVLLLKHSDYTPIILTRNKKIAKNSEDFSYWNPGEKIIDILLLSEIDFIIHLAGENIIAKHWSEKQKQKIISSRVNTALFLFDSLKKVNHKVQKIVSASAIGYYNQENNNIQRTEIDSYGSGFASECCKLWEESVDRFTELDISVVKIRIGLVLSNKSIVFISNYYSQMFGILTQFGDGKQAFPWIHISDLTHIFKSALEKKVNGVFNAVSKENITLKEFLNNLKLNFGFALILQIPAFILKIFLKERSELFLKGSPISSEKLNKELYQTKYNSIIDAWRDLRSTI